MVSSPQGLLNFSFTVFIFKDIAHISKPFIFLCYITQLHLALATPSNLDSSGQNPATASEILKQMLSTMSLPPFALTGKGLAAAPALSSAKEPLDS